MQKLGKIWKIYIMSVLMLRTRFQGEAQNN